MTALVKQSSTQLALKFFLTQSADHITGLTGATPTVTIRKEGGAFAAPSGAVTEIANGWYQVAGNATDTNTLGEIVLHATAASADPFDGPVALVVGFDPQAALATPTNITAATGITVSTNSDKTGYSLTQAFPTNFSAMGITAGGNVSSDLKAINTDTTSAANLAKTTGAVATGTVTAGATTTSIPTSAFSPSGTAADQFKGRIVTFTYNTTTAALRGQSTDITASSASATPTLTVTALTSAPTSGDTFVVT